MEIAKRNIFDEIIGKGVSTYESAILTCFSFDPLYFLQYYLPKLNSINITNIVVLIDALQYDQACEEFIRYKEASRKSIQLNFSPVRMTPSFHGVFHPKVVFLVGPKQCTALVGSGNLTYGGMTYNNEVWNAFSANNADAEEAPVVASVWKYLSSLVGSGQNTVREQLTWMSFYSDSLKAIETVKDVSAGRFHLLVNSAEEGIGQQVIRIVGEEKVKDLTIVSPFFDRDGYALEYLVDNLHPESVLCLGDEDAGTWPFAMNDDLLSRIEFRGVAGEDMESRTHAKILQIHTETSTLLLSGSANATAAGLGLTPVRNDEATVLIIQEEYRDFISEMGIAAGEPVLLQKISGSKKQDTTSMGKEVSVLSCELWNGVYLLSLSRNITDVDILRKDYSGSDCPPVHFERLSKREKINYEVLSGTASFVLARNGIPISNRILVLVDNNVRNYCPDKAMKQLTRLMDVSKGQDWDSNITQILSFVTFEEDAPSSSRSTVPHSRNGATSHTQQDTVIDRDDFSASPLESDASRRNNRVLDYFFRFISSDDHDSGEIEEEFSPAEIDKGTAVGDDAPEPRKAKPKTNNKQVISELDVYLGRLGRHYDDRCKKFDKAKRPVFLDASTDIQLTAKTKAYSSCLIAVVLLLQLAKDNEKSLDKIEDSLIHRRLLALLGRFFLLYRDFNIEGDGYLSIRMQEMKQNILVHSLILLSHLEWGVRLKGISRLMVLNLLDMYDSTSSQLASAVDSFEHSINTYMLPNPNSLEEVRGCIQSFMKSKPTPCDLKDVSFPAIIYKKRLGFLMCSKAIRSRTPNKEALEYEITVLSPGFKEFEPIELHNSKKVALYHFDYD